MFETWNLNRDFDSSLKFLWSLWKVVEMNAFKNLDIIVFPFHAFHSLSNWKEKVEFETKLLF